MNLGWKSLIPLSIANIIVTGLVLLAWPKIESAFAFLN
jgi:NADH:ubiquinone oxidoreductase subunit H